MFSCNEIPQNGIITKKWNEEYKEYETSVKRRHKVGEITTWKTIKYNNYDGEDFGITVKYTTLKKQKEYSKKYYLTKEQWNNVNVNDSVPLDKYSELDFNNKKERK
jgi:hypothetical protein